MDADDLPAWLRLLETPLIGRASARRLLAAFATAEAVFDADRAARSAVVGPELAEALETAPKTFDTLLATTRAWLAGASSEAPRSLLALGDADYPAQLLQAADPPLLLYLQGRRTLLGGDMLAIVGSRKPTPQGLETARSFAAALGRHGLTIVSGLALGIDGAAHEGALDAGAASIAVVGTGLDRVYPARHRALAHRLAVHGLLISEYPIGTPPLAENFPPRNRIIAGLSRGTLVVEAALKSGSLISARLSAESGREVFAVPGSIHSLQSQGCHALIKQGAKLVENVEDVLEEFSPRTVGMAAPPAAETADAGPSGPTAEPAAPENALLEALGHGPVSLDALVARTGMPVPMLGAALLELELAGRVARLPGQLFQRIGFG